jgi:hypothetical protein
MVPFCRCMGLEMYPFLLDLLIYWSINFQSIPNDPLHCIGSCCNISPCFSSLLLFIWIFSLYFLLVWLKDLSTLYIFLMNQLSLCFINVLSIPSLIIIICFCLLIWSLSCSCFQIPWGTLVGHLFEMSNFYCVHTDIKFLLISALAVFQMFW